MTEKTITISQRLWHLIERRATEREDTQSALYLILVNHEDAVGLEREAVDDLEDEVAGLIMGEEGSNEN